MQLLTAAPRTGMSAPQVRALLTADDITVDVGMETVDANGDVVEDLSAYLDGGTVSWSGSVDVHRECALKVTRELGWDRDRVRPWMTLTSEAAGLSARWWLGVFILASPSYAAGDGDTREASGYDLLHLLACPIGNTWSVDQGDNVLEECARLIAATSFGPRVLFDTTKRDATFSTEMVWPLFPVGGGNPASTTWLQVLTEMLASIGYEAPWVDEAGQLRSGPIVLPSERDVEWELSADDALTTIVGPVRTRRQDLTTIPNAWIFVAGDWDLDPIEGDGLYRPPVNQSVGPTSIDARAGHVVYAVRTLTAQVQEDLVTQAKAIVEADQRAASVRDVQLNPFPMMGHRDLYRLVDAELGGSVRALASSWTLNLDASNGPLTVEEILT